MLALGIASGLGLGGMVLNLADGQNPPAGGTSSSASMPQIPFGQTYKDFQFPLYQNGQLTATLSAVSAQGITVNRAETTDLKIDLYTEGKVTTTITSPKADLYVADRKMRTKNTVVIERADLEATAQSCDFDLATKKYLLRDHVRVVLKNFDTGTATKTAGGAKPANAAPASLPTSTSLPVPPDTATPQPEPEPAPTSSLNSGTTPQHGDSMLDTPGAFGGNTNVAPIQPPPPVNP